MSKIAQHYALVIDVVCPYFGITEEDIKLRNKRNDIVRPRHIVMFCLYFSRGRWFKYPGGQSNEYGGSSVGALIKRDHGTVMHGHDMIYNAIELAIITGDYRECNAIKAICVRLKGLGFDLPMNKFEKIVAEITASRKPVQKFSIVE